jgi:hypothetical protein
LITCIIKEENRLILEMRFGGLYDVFGKEMVFDLLNDLISVIPTFNEALRCINQEQHQIE